MTAGPTPLPVAVEPVAARYCLRMHAAAVAAEVAGIRLQASGCSTRLQHSAALSVLTGLIRFGGVSCGRSCSWCLGRSWSGGRLRHVKVALEAAASHKNGGAQSTSN